MPQKSQLRQWVLYVSKHPAQATIRLFAIPIVAAAVICAGFYSHSRQSQGGTDDERPETAKEETDNALALYTLWLTGFTGVLAVSTVGLWLTTRRGMRDQARDMAASLRIADLNARAAIDAAKAGQESTEIARVTMGADRGWMIPDQPVINKGDSGTINGRTATGPLVAFQSNWINLGRSPCINAEVAGVIRPVPIQSVEIIHFNLDFYFKRTGQGAVIGQGVRAQSIQWGLNEEETRAVFDRQLSVIIYSSVIYHDIFDSTKERFSEQCRKITYSGRYTPIGSTVEQDGWDIAVWGPQNRAT